MNKEIKLISEAYINMLNDSSNEQPDEQLDELSVMKLVSYRKKAGSDYDNGTEISDDPLSKSEFKKLSKRGVSLDSADKKIKDKTGTYTPGLITQIKDKLSGKLK